MATGLKSRIIYREKTSSQTEGSYWAGTYKLLLRAKAIPSPFGSQNMVDTSTLEVEVLREQGINSVFAQLSAQGVQVLSMRNKANRLEELFVTLVHDRKGESA